MNRDELLKCLTELDFMAVDLGLYLNTHPHDEEATRKYNEAIEEAEKLRMTYETNFGPLCSFRSPARMKWTWINKPWPWQEKFNFEIRRP